MDLNTARGRMTRRATKTTKYIAELETTIKDKSLDVVETRWLRDVCCTISADRESYNRLSEYVADNERDETQMETDEKTVNEYQNSVQEALRLYALCHSMKNVMMPPKLWMRTSTRWRLSTMTSLIRITQPTSRSWASIWTLS